jgi:hypothetical protein
MSFGGSAAQHHCEYSVIPVVRSLSRAKQKRLSPRGHRDHSAAEPQPKTRHALDGRHSQPCRPERGNVALRRFAERGDTEARATTRHPEPAKRGEGSQDAPDAPKPTSESQEPRILRSFAVYAAQDDGLNSRRKDWCHWKRERGTSRGRAARSSCCAPPIHPGPSLDARDDMLLGSRLTPASRRRRSSDRDSAALNI